MALTPAQIARELTPTPTGSETSRSFYQSRVSLFFFVIGGLSVVFFLLHNLLEVLFGNLTVVQVFTFPLNHWQLTGVAIAGLFGVAARHGEPSLTALAWIDVGGAATVLTCDAMMGSAILGVAAPHFDLVLTLAYVLVQMTRAVIVPSSVRRTIAACLAGAVPIVFMGWLLAWYAPDAWSLNRVVYAPLYVGLWCLDAAIPAALASSVIYGLRQQVREAKQLGQYTLEERLGEGGMGTVYRARHALLRRPTHRDIKPANIIVCEHGGARDVVKVVDFGLVKSFEAEEPDLSVADAIVGTPHFLAPEAIRSASAVDARTDLYSLGAVGYFLLAGEYVFDGDGVMEVCIHHLNTPPVPLSQRAQQSVPDALEAALMRRLAKDPAARPQTAAALHKELAACGVAEWSDQEAEAWWSRRRELQRTDAQRQALSRTPTALEVDVGARVRLT